MALADVEGAKIHLNQLILSHQLASWESIQEILISHYTRQFLHEMYKVTFLGPTLAKYFKNSFLDEITCAVFLFNNYLVAVFNTIVIIELDAKFCRFLVLLAL